MGVLVAVPVQPAVQPGTQVGANEYTTPTVVYVEDGPVAPIQTADTTYSAPDAPTHVDYIPQDQGMDFFPGTQVGPRAIRPVHNFNSYDHGDWGQADPRGVWSDPSVGHHPGGYNVNTYENGPVTGTYYDSQMRGAHVFPGYPVPGNYGPVGGLDVNGTTALSVLQSQLELALSMTANPADFSKGF